MTKAEELNLTNLLNNLNTMEEEYKKKTNDEEANKIRKFAIDALTDYYDTEKKICALISHYRHLFGKDGIPYIKGSDVGKVNGKDFTITLWNFPLGTFIFTTGMFTLEGAGKEKFNNLLEVKVDNIKGVKQRDNGSWRDEFEYNKEWNPISLEIYKVSTDADKPWDNDLIKSHFTAEGKSKPYTIENLKKYNWNVEGWTHIKEMANRTRKRTEEIVRRFKTILDERIAERTKQLSTLETESQSVYVKVTF